jgi:hypothetical protein
VLTCGLKEGDLASLSMKEEAALIKNVQEELLVAVKEDVVDVDCRRLRAGSIVADCVMTLKVFCANIARHIVTTLLCA